MEDLKLIYRGKTKDVYEKSDGSYVLKIKDDATGKDGKFDPGENAVGLSIEGLGKASLRMSKYFFELINKQGIPTHYLDCDLDEVTMNVLAVTMFGQGLEFVCRRKAVGSFIRRYGQYAKEGQELDYLVEVTLKDDEKGDPLITKDALVMLEVISEEDYEICKDLTQRITKIIYEDLVTKGLELYDIKYEFGKHQGKTILIDEVSASSMRVYKDNEVVEPLELTRLILEA